jgi:hypothetical protein
VSVIGLVMGVLYVGAGGLTIAAGAINERLTGFMDGLVATPSPTAPPVVVSDAPLIALPEEPYTNEAAVDLVVTVPAHLTGDTEHRLRIYLALKDQAPTPIGEVPMGLTQQMVVPVELEEGINDFSLTIVGPGGESESSPVVRYVLDQSDPKITISSPKNKAKINRQAVTITGKTQARTTVVARNEANDASISVTAAGDGTFELALPLAPGTNSIVLTGTDPAGNVGTAELTVKRGTGKLTVALSVSSTKIKRSSLPATITVGATVKDPDGRAMAGVPITFTVSVPGIATITRDATTAGNGRAAFEATIPASATTGQGLATVLVTTSEFGSVDDTATITITK